jgi:hypothetical protein
LRFFSRSCSCLTCPYVAPHTAKIHTLITLGIRVRTDPHVSRPGTAFPLGSIPIARSTLKQCQATQGDSIRVNTLIRWEGLGNRRWGATVSWPHVSLHCPEIHTYSHTQKFSKINHVNSHAPLIASDRTRTRCRHSRLSASDQSNRKPPQKTSIGGGAPPNRVSARCTLVRREIVARRNMRALNPALRCNAVAEGEAGVAPQRLFL